MEAASPMAKPVMFTWRKKRERLYELKIFIFFSFYVLFLISLYRSYNRAKNAIG
jgi:hypothetical protein